MCRRNADASSTSELVIVSLPEDLRRQMRAKTVRRSLAEGMSSARGSSKCETGRGGVLVGSWVVCNDPTLQSIT